MREKIELPDDYSEIPQAERKQPECSPEEFKAYATDDSLVPAMPAFGSGYRWHVTGLVHDETGFPKGTPAATLAATNRQHDKLYNNLDDIVQVENYQMEDAEYAVIAFGGGARTAYEAVDMARREGLKVGLMRPITIWPLADRQIKELASKVKRYFGARAQLRTVCTGSRARRRRTGTGCAVRKIRQRTGYPRSAAS